MTQRLEPDPHLDALIRRLNDAARRAGEGPDASPEQREALPAAAAAPSVYPGSMTLPDLPVLGDELRDWLRERLALARARHASDLFFVAGSPPVARIDGALVSLGGPDLDGNTTASIVAAIVPDSRHDEARRGGTLDFSVVRPDAGRLRCNVHRERGNWAAAVRFLAEVVPDLAALNLPAALSRLAELDHGLVLVTGSTGCGKSTTLAALLRRRLARRPAHLITIEDPVEYEHAHTGGVVEHVEVGRDAPSFAAALRAALRQSPDVLLIGEMRDPESISIAITAAETGHLVFSTLHTGDAPQTIHRVLDSYPAAQMEIVRAQLSVSLAGIVSQQLLPRRDGHGRVPAVEILVATPAVRNLVRQGKIAHLRSQITLEHQAGMLSLDRSLARLVRSGLVAPEEARPRARVPEEFDGLLGHTESP